MKTPPLRILLSSIAMAAGLAASALLVSCTTTDLVTGKDVQNLYSIEDDIQLGQEAYAEFAAEMEKAGVPINQDRDKLGELREMTDRIAGVSHGTNFVFEVNLFQTNIVNAMAMPGGKLIVFEGLWDPKEGLVRDDDELAAVMAHEIAHVTCRHSTEELTAAMPAELILLGAAIYAEVDENEDLQMAVGAAFLLYEGLWVPKYSRGQEAEADAVGLMYMAKAGYNPEAAVRLWKRAHEMEGDEWPVLSIFSTHPSNEYRYKKLQELLPEAMTLYAQSQGGGRPKTERPGYKYTVRRGEEPKKRRAAGSE